MRLVSLTHLVCTCECRREGESSAGLVCQGRVAHAVAVRGADVMVLSDPGAAFVPGAGYSKLQGIPWSVPSAES